MVLLRHLLGDALRRLRLRQGRTLREVSAAARVSLGYLSEVERGQKEASSELLGSICSALNTPLSQVLREVSDNFALAELQSEPIMTGVREPVGTGPGAPQPGSAAEKASLAVAPAPARLGGAGPLSDRAGGGTPAAGPRRAADQLAGRGNRRLAAAGPRRLRRARPGGRPRSRTWCRSETAQPACWPGAQAVLAGVPGFAGYGWERGWAGAGHALSWPGRPGRVWVRPRRGGRPPAC